MVMIQKDGALFEKTVSSNTNWSTYGMQRYDNTQQHLSCNERINRCHTIVNNKRVNFGNCESKYVLANTPNDSPMDDDEEDYLNALNESNEDVFNNEKLDFETLDKKLTLKQKVHNTLNGMTTKIDKNRFISDLQIFFNRACGSTIQALEQEFGSIKSMYFLDLLEDYDFICCDDTVIVELSTFNRWGMSSESKEEMFRDYVNKINIENNKKYYDDNGGI